MPGFFERYQQGAYQEVYDELSTLREKVFDDAILDDAFCVGREMMRRVRFNFEELLIPRLKQIGYRFGDGSWDHAGHLSNEELLHIQHEEPIFQPSTTETPMHIATLEQMVGQLPVSLQCWYEQVEAINFIGALRFPLTQKTNTPDDKPGYGLDPIHTQPLSDVREEIRDFGCEVDEQGRLMLPISLDGDFKYGYGGGGDYQIAIPCKAFDGLLLGERHKITFVNYLRLCLQWGGLPGLADDCPLPQEELDFLTQNLLPF